MRVRRAVDDRVGSEAVVTGRLSESLFCPRKQTSNRMGENVRLVPTTVICSTAHWHFAMPVEEPSTASEADLVWAE